MSLQLLLVSWRSRFIVCCQFILGRPLSLLSLGVHQRVWCARRLEGRRATWPNHFRRLLQMVVDTDLISVWLPYLCWSHSILWLVSYEGILSQKQPVVFLVQLLSCMIRIRTIGWTAHLCCRIACFNTQSIATAKRSGDRMHPCLTSVSTWNQSLRPSSVLIQQRGPV